MKDIGVIGVLATGGVWCCILSNPKRTKNVSGSSPEPSTKKEA